ncbi:hypothetical protein BDR03DRAFT_939930 [Suillus americanus]|nr:hypothetical protein BDR03DRAFT_939930 [Suillus americanus]
MDPRQKVSRDNWLLVDIVFEMKDWSEGPNPERALGIISLISTVIRGAINIHNIVLRAKK